MATQKGNVLPRMASDDAESVQAREALNLTEADLMRLRDEYFHGWRSRNYRCWGGQSTWPFYSIGVATEDDRRLVIAAMPPRVRASVRIRSAPRTIA